jgi:DUF4097 and DUF4098 domain-containing protein YvlB
MKLNQIFIIAVLAFIMIAAPLARARRDDDDEDRTERTLAAQPNVTVTACLATGDIKVHGWDRREVRVRSDAEKIELRPDDANSHAPASSVEVLLSDSESKGHPAACQAFCDIELDVPRGAVLHLNSRDGNVVAMDVAEANIQTTSGDIALEKISRGVDAGSISGNVSLKDSSGRVTLHSISGSVDASNVSAAGGGDDFNVNSVSGDIALDRVAHLRVQAGTVSGEVNITGPLAHGGRYGLKTLSGDITLVLPGDSSFQIDARVSRQGEIITDFPLKLTGESMVIESNSPGVPSPPARGRKIHLDMPLELRHVSGTYGTGDAVINISSFSGTIHLRRK